MTTSKSRTPLPEKLLGQFLDLSAKMSPEELTDGGELPLAKAVARRKQLQKEWARLEKQAGRRVTEEEIGRSRVAGQRQQTPTNEQPTNPPPPWEKPETGGEEDVVPEITEGLFDGVTRVVVGAGYLGTESWVILSGGLPPALRDACASADKFKRLKWVSAKTAVTDLSKSPDLIDKVRSYMTPRPNGRTLFRTPFSFDHVTGTLSHLLRVYVSKEGEVVLFNDGVVNALGDPAVLHETYAGHVSWATKDGWTALAPMGSKLAQDVVTVLGAKLFQKPLIAGPVESKAIPMPTLQLVKDDSVKNPDA